MRQSLPSFLHLLNFLEIQKNLWKIKPNAQTSISLLHTPQISSGNSRLTLHTNPVTPKSKNFSLEFNERRRDSLGRAERKENIFTNSLLSSSTEDQARPFSNINELLSTFTQINKSLRELEGPENRNVSGWPPRAWWWLWFIWSLCLRDNLGNFPVSGNYPGWAMLGKDPWGPYTFIFLLMPAYGGREILYDCKGLFLFSHTLAWGLPSLLSEFKAGKGP